MRSIIRHPATAATLFAAASLIFVACSDSTTTGPTALRAPAAPARDSGAALSIPGGATQIAIVSNGSTQYCGIAAGEFAPVFGVTTFVAPPLGTPCKGANDVNALLISTYNPGWDTPFTGSDWIGPTDDDAPSNEYRARPGTYDYKATFTIPSGATGVGLNLSTMGDNVVQTWINGHLLGKNNPTQDCPPSFACYWLQSHAVSMFDNNQAHFVIGGTNTIEIFVIDTRIGVGPAADPAPPDFNGNSCELGPQTNGSLGFGTGYTCRPIRTTRRVARAWSSTTCLNPTGLDFAGVAFYTPAVITGKSFTIGPSSMEGAIRIGAGDFVNGGYSFKFVSPHTATSFSVTSSVTISGPCRNAGGQLTGTSDVVTVPMGTITYPISAGNATDWLPTGDANSVLSWEGSVQAPAGLCGGGGATLDASKGAVFHATVLQSPPSGSLVDFRFKYRDPAAKGKPNTNCLDTSDPNRAKADVCGASWSQTVRDP